MNLLLALAAGTLLWAALAAGRKAVDATAHRSAVLGRLQRYVPLIRVVAWYLFGFWLLRRWGAGRPLLPALLLLYLAVPALGVAWYVLRDVLAWAVTSGRGQLRLHHRIQCGGVSGTIVAKRVTHIVVQTDPGETARIPYTRLSGEIVRERSEDAGSDRYSIRIRPGKPGAPEDLREALARDLAAIPWACPQPAPVIELKERSGDDCEFEVRFRSLDRRHAARVERVLRGIHEGN